MTIPNYVKQQAIQLRLQAQTLAAILEDDAGRRVAALVERSINAMLRDAVNARDPIELLAQLRNTLDVASTGSANIMANLAADTFDISLDVNWKSTEVFGVMSQRAAIQAALQFENTMRADLISAAWSDWYTRIQSSALETGSGLRAAVEHVAVNGGSLNEAVKQFIQDDPILQGLPKIRQNIGIEARARRVVRTESARIDNAVSIGFSESAGISQFVNVGVGDSRQSEICREATVQPAMTLDEWRVSQWGLAPRHPNCRCQMMGVPGEYKFTDAELDEYGAIMGDA